LKDLPGWFFGLRYIFGSETTNVTKQELLIVLRAEVVDPLRARADDDIDRDLVDERRRSAQEALRRLGKEYAEDAEFPSPQSSEQESEDEPTEEP
jgi:type IV pilus assembly protein PilQ